MARIRRRVSFLVPYEVKIASIVVPGVLGVLEAPVWRALGHAHADRLSAFFAFAFLGDLVSDALWHRLGRRGRLPAWALVPAGKGESRPLLMVEWRAHRDAVRRAADPTRVLAPHAYPGRPDATYRAPGKWPNDNG